MCVCVCVCMCVCVWWVQSVTHIYSYMCTTQNEKALHAVVKIMMMLIREGSYLGWFSHTHSLNHRRTHIHTCTQHTHTHIHTHTHTHTHAAKGLHHIAFQILSYLDSRSLCRAEQVCSDWYQVIDDGLLWKKLIERKVATDTVWKGLSERRGW